MNSTKCENLKKRRDETRCVFVIAIASRYIYASLNINEIRSRVNERESESWVVQSPEDCNVM